MVDVDYHYRIRLWYLLLHRLEDRGGRESSSTKFVLPIQWPFVCAHPPGGANIFKQFFIEATAPVPVLKYSKIYDTLIG
jgi:hypothetical protein